MRIKTRIDPQLLKRVLARGMILASLGALLIVTVGSHLPRSEMKFLGLPLLLAGLLLIASGLVPYRRLSKLQDHPDELLLEGDALHYIQRGRPLLRLPLCAIEQLKPVQKNDLYGLALWLNQKAPQLSKINLLGQKRFGCSLFLPFFPKKSVQELQARL